MVRTSAGQFTHSSNGSFNLTLPDGSVSKFSPAGKLTSIADRNGNQTGLICDSANHLSTITDPFGRTLNVAVNSNGQVQTISDSLGLVATYSYG